MISGKFGDAGQLLFDIELIAANGERFPTEVLLDTGFTSGWLAINSQDIDALEWRLIKTDELMQTARGEEYFDIYAGKLLLDGIEFDIPVVAGLEMPENLLGLQWLQTMRLVVDYKAGMLTLG